MKVEMSDEELARSLALMPASTRSRIERGAEMLGITPVECFARAISARLEKSEPQVMAAASVVAASPLVH